MSKIFGHIGCTYSALWLSPDGLVIEKHSGAMSVKQGCKNERVLHSNCIGTTWMRLSAGKQNNISNSQGAMVVAIVVAL
jgi:hypothetical protein